MSVYTKENSQSEDNSCENHSRESLIKDLDKWSILRVYLLENLRTLGSEHKGMFESKGRFIKRQEIRQSNLRVLDIASEEIKVISAKIKALETQGK